MASSTHQTMESTSSPLVLKRKSEDVGWKYGDMVDVNNKDKVKCNKCGKVMRGGINRLKQHIAGIKGEVTACSKSTKEEQTICRNALNDVKIKRAGKKLKEDALRADVRIDNETIDVDEMVDCFGDKTSNSFGPIDRFTSKEFSNKGKGKQADVSNVIRKEQNIHVKEYICRWAYECAIPFHAFEKDSFKMMAEAIGMFGPRVQTPTRYELGETYLKKEVERTKTLLKKYEDDWKLNGCSIMTDAWSDRKRRSIMNLCVNSKLGTVFLSSKECSNESHTSEHIYEYVESCILEVGPENVVQVVTDNAANNMGAAKLLKAKRPNIFWTSCATHTINLMLEAIGGLPKYKKILDQAKKLTVFVYAHHKSLALMRHFTKKRDIVRPGVTRFASAFLTLQSLAEKKAQLRQMFTSDEWDKCKLSTSIKGTAAFGIVISSAFWGGVTTCLKVFAPLVKVLRMVDADWKPSMGFLHGELEKAKKDIIIALNDKKNLYDPIIEIIEKKSLNRLDTCLHLAAYILNPFYLYNNPEIQNDIKVTDAIGEIIDTLFPEDYEMINLILLNELPMYYDRQGKFEKVAAMKGCEVNNDYFFPANWWLNYGSSTPNLRKIAMRILSLTTSSSGCERNWSTFEGVHTKKRNRLETTKLNNLVYVQFNANLMEKNNKRKKRGNEVLLSYDASHAQDWIVEGEDEDEVEPGLSWKVVGDAMGADEGPRTSARTKTRELLEDFESEDEEEVNEEVEYESDEGEIKEVMEQYGEDLDESTI